MVDTAQLAAPAFEDALDWGRDEEEEPLPDQQQQVKSFAQHELENREGSKPVVKQAQEEVARGGLMFVRIPKSDVQDRSVEIAQQEFEVQLTTCRLLNENRRLKKLEKSDARNNTFKALELLKVANENVKSKRNELMPLRTANLQRKTARTALMESKRQIEATTEQELDALIKKVEYELEHVTLSLKEEKEHIAQLKRLKQQRPRIQTFALQSQVLDAKTNANEIVKGDHDQLEKEHKILKEEQAECERIYSELKALETELDKELAEMNEEYDAAIITKNKAFDKLKAAREERRKRTSDFTLNREFSRRVRDLVAQGDVRSGRDLCEDQTDRMIEKLRTDVEYRKEYLRLWETQRKPLTTFTVDDGSSTNSKPKNLPKSKKFTSMVDGVQTEPGQSIAEAVVARVMREAKGETLTKSSNAPRITEPDGNSQNHTKPASSAPKEVPKKKSTNPNPVAKVTKVENDFVLPEVIVREVLNKKPEAATPVMPKKASGSLKDAKKEKATKKKQKKLDEKKMKMAEEKAAREKAEQQARQAELKAMQAQVLDAQANASASPASQTKPAVRERAVVLPDPVIRRGGRKTVRSRPKPSPKGVTALVDKYWIPLVGASIGVILLAISIYMSYA